MRLLKFVHRASQIAFLCCITAFAAHDKISSHNHQAYPDSMDSAIEKSAGPRKVDLLNNAVYYIHRENFEKAKSNAEKALAIAVLQKYGRGEATALLNIGYVHFLRNKIDSSLACYKKSFSLIEQNQISDLLPMAYNNMGLTLWRKSDFLGALSNYKQAAVLARESGNATELGRAYNNIGLIYWKSGDYSECNDFFLKALSIRDQLGEPFDRVTTINNLARFYYEISDFKRCLEYSQKAFAIARSVDDKYGLGRAYSNIGFAYAGLKQYEKAIESLTKSLEMKQSSNDVPGIAFTLSEIGHVYYEQGQYEMALQYFGRAVKIRKEIRYIYGISDNYKQIALVFIKQNKIPQALNYIAMSLEIAVKNDMKDIVRVCYEELAKINEAKGNYSASLRYYKLFVSLKDSIEGRSKTERISQLTNRYESEIKEKEIVQLTNRQKIQQLEIDKKNMQIYLLWSGLALVLGFITYIFFKYKSEQKIKQELTYSNTTKDKLFSIIAHDLRSPFIGLLGYTEILKEDYNDLPDDMRKQYISNIDNTIKELFKLLEGLLEWAKVQSRNLTYKPEPVNLNETAQNAVLLLQQAITNKGIEIEIDVDEKLLLFADAQMAYSILRNLLSNAIKFSDNGQKITITAKKKAEHVEIRVIDTGAGIPSEHLHKLFSPGSKFSTTGTRGEKGTGIGLSIVSELVKINKGEIRIESTIGKGSTFIINLPGKN